MYVSVCVCVLAEGTQCDEWSMTGVGDEISNYHTLIPFFLFTHKHTPHCGVDPRFSRERLKMYREESEKVKKPKKLYSAFILVNILAVLNSHKLIVTSKMKACTELLDSFSHINESCCQIKMKRIKKTNSYINHYNGLHGKENTSIGCQVSVKAYKRTPETTLILSASFINLGNHSNSSFS